MSFKAGFVGIVGLPNSGKSTLVNLLVGEKVSIVTSKPQTTRRRVMGVINQSDSQAILVDAPGMVSAKAGLNQFLQEEMLEVISESDALIVVLSVDEGKMENFDPLFKIIQDSGKPWMAVIHKTDLPQMHRPQILKDRLNEFKVPVIQGSSVQNSESLKEQILNKLSELLPESEGPLYESDLYTLSSLREIAAEIIREKCFLELHQEIPFGIAVQIVAFREDEGPTVMIDANVFVAKENHKPMVVGKGGQVLKNIGRAARLEIQELLGRKVFLTLNVAARPNWTRQPQAMKEFGYVTTQA